MPPPVVTFIEFGFSTAREFWDEVTCPAFSRFINSPTKQHAIESSLSVWHVTDWLWHERHPESTWTDFQNRVLRECPELAWVRDVAEAGKHRGLNRPGVEVKSVVRGVSDLTRKDNAGDDISWMNVSAQPAQSTLGRLVIVLDDYTTRQFDCVLKAVMDYWKTNWFKS